MNHNTQVEMFIDKKRYESPNPTTGAALYLLGKVDPNTYDLYLEVRGKGDDELIPNDNTGISLKNGDHLFTVQKKLNPGGECH
ncbi:MAG: hypothetical protein EPN47_13895 [Acidobacteria bacterium]|nr:MAG: hypothetical protein EPN47_13895 [Acidobacteriota bacterium]